MGEEGDEALTVCEYGWRSNQGVRELKDVGVKASAVSLDQMKHDPKAHQEALGKARRASRVFMFVNREAPEMRDKYPQIEELEQSAQNGVEGPEGLWDLLVRKIKGG
jgi:hypothetical protein